MKSVSNEVRRARPLLGAFVEICVGGKETELLHCAIDQAFRAIGRAHRLMSFHDPASDVSRLNRQAAAAPVIVHPWTWRALEAARKFSTQSDGAFDITVAPLLQYWGYLPGRSAFRRRATWRDIVLEPDSAVGFLRPLALDLGGIAKGFAVDRAVEALRAAGVPRGIVNAGGDLRVFGGNKQKVHIRHPLAPGQTAGVMSLSEHSMATSALYFARRRAGRRAVSPLIHGRTRRPCVDDVSVTVVAADCLTADALTKIVLALRDAARPILDIHRADALLAGRGFSPRFLSSNHAPEFVQA